MRNRPNLSKHISAGRWERAEDVLIATIWLSLSAGDYVYKVTVIGLIRHLLACASYVPDEHISMVSRASTIID